MFWYEGTVLNADLTASVPVWLANQDGTVGNVVRVDDYTVRFEFDFPYTLFMTEMTFRDGGDATLAAFLPGHYLEQFHPDFADAAELQRQITAAGLTTWTQLFMQRALPISNPERPTMAAWVPYQSTVSDPIFTLRRNPYYIGVDTAGNQLPYIDEVQFRFFADQQALNFAAVAGEFDFQARHIQMTNYPVLVENAERSGYRVITWPTFGGSDAAVWINQQYTIDPELGELLANRDFRIALSIGINRDEIRESAFLGLGEIRQPVPAPWHPYYPGDEAALNGTPNSTSKRPTASSTASASPAAPTATAGSPAAPRSASRSRSSPPSAPGRTWRSSSPPTGRPSASPPTSRSASAARTGPCATATS
jgi:peptide/nickel transport system substrate-binding protein